MKRIAPLPCSAVCERRGTTLTEVLMSLMVMSIGVVSLATLFPISAARVLEATNLTNSTVLLYNAEGIVDSFPAIIHEPDGDPATRESGRIYQVDPLGYWERFRTLDLSDGSIDDSLSAAEEQKLFLFEHNRPTLVTLPATQNPAGTLLQTRYLGEDAGSPSLFPDADVARAIVSLPDTTTDYGQGFPDPDGTNSSAYALNTNNRITGLVLPIEVDLKALSLNSTDTGYQDPSQYQALIFDKSGDYSEVRQLATVKDANNDGLYEITWEQDLNADGDTGDAGEDRALPARFTDPVDASSTMPNYNVGLVRIELPLSDYTWLLTVRKKISGPANVDVVVFRKRDFSELSDQVYVGDLRRFTLGADGLPGEAGVDDDDNGTTDDISEIGYPRLPPGLSDDQPNNRLTVDWTVNTATVTTTNGYPATPIAPPILRGGYLFDPLNGLWYRILRKEKSATNPDTSAVVILEDSISRYNTEDRNGNFTLDGDTTAGNGITSEDANDNGTLDRGGVIIPPGVVAVFPLETKVP